MTRTSSSTSGKPTSTTTTTVSRPAALRSSGVCRNLFAVGPADHEQLSRELSARLRDISEQDARRWNFNFQSDAPLAGSFQWEEAECAAPFYQEKTLVCSKSHPEEERDVRCSPGLKNTEEPGVLETNQENCSIVSNTQKMMMMMMPEVVPVVRRKRTFSQLASSKKTANNTKITDFFVKRRRTSETKSILLLHPEITSDQSRSQRI